MNLSGRWVGPKLVIPMHFWAFPFLVQDADGFSEAAANQCDARIVVLGPGKSIDV